MISNKKLTFIYTNKYQKNKIIKFRDKFKLNLILKEIKIKNISNLNYKLKLKNKFAFLYSKNYKYSNMVNFQIFKNFKKKPLNNNLLNFNLENNPSFILKSALLKTFKNDNVNKIKNIPDLSSGIYIYGTGVIAKQVFLSCNENKIKVKGFIDNLNSSLIKKYLSKRIYKLNSINRNSIIIIASGNYAIKIKNILKKKKIKYIINLSEFFNSLHKTNEPEKNFFSDLIENRYRYLNLIGYLEDDISKKIINLIFKYRFSFNLNYLSKAKMYSGKNQWFDKKIIKNNNNYTFLDGGAYDGDTIEEFLKFNSNKYRKIYGFEINKKNFLLMKKKFKNFKNIFLYNNAITNNNNKVVYFSSTSQTSSRIEKKNKSKPIKTIKIDNFLNQEDCFIKLDIEGQEKKALIGAKKIIKSKKTMLAIASYHFENDLWKLASIILKFNTNYKFYVRHYTQSSYETVLYCI